jgi:hypothetical protein
MASLANQWYRYQIHEDQYPYSKPIGWPSLQSFPNLCHKPDWYNLPLLSKTCTIDKLLSYTVQAKAMAKALQKAGVHGVKVTHDGRVTGTRMAEAAGASASDIAWAGGWSTGVMENTYMSNLPRETMRTLAGFSPVKGGFFLERAVRVPEELCRMVFPQIEAMCVNIIVPICRSCEEIGRTDLKSFINRICLWTLQRMVS